MDSNFFKSSEEMVKEMLRQRLTQDYQQVPQSVIIESWSNKGRDSMENLREAFPTKQSSSSGLNRDNMTNGFFKKSGGPKRPNIGLSMGHRIQTMTIYPNAIYIALYTRRDAINVFGGNIFNYNFKLWLPTSEQYLTASQTFDKYQEDYRWNRLDRLIAGAKDLYLPDDAR